MSKGPKVFIIILNWNGWKDTIDCLQSLTAVTYPDFEIVIVDNNSQDESVKKIKGFISDNKGSLTFHLVENNDNMGFAKGNNVGIRYAQNAGADHVLLLNNDTVVEKDFLEKIITFKLQHPEYVALTPQIRFYDVKDKIWNCGGEISSLGFRKYFFNNQNYTALPAVEYLDISFVTGCALFLDYKKTGLLSEKFFFGEEDFEFSMRMKKSNQPIACILGSIIYHKVSSSVNKLSDKSKLGIIYIYYLNRLINMRSFMNSFLWRIWCYIYSVYIFYLLNKTGYAKNKVLSMLKVLLKNSGTMDSVSKEHFQNASAGKFFEI